MLTKNLPNDNNFKTMRAYDLPNYDNWLTEPYDRYYEDIDPELEEHLENLRAMDYIDDQKDYCEAYKIEYSEIAHYI